MTDAHVVLGTLDPELPLAGGVRLDVAAARTAVASLAASLGLDPLACARGILRVADAEMGRALRVMTVERGVDPRDFALLAYGGAGGLHAAGLAARLGIRRVLVPQAGGVLSALGLAAAERRTDRARTVLLRGAAITAEALRPVPEAFDPADPGPADRAALSPPGEPDAPPAPGETGARSPQQRTTMAYDVRYAGQSFELTVRDCPPEPGAMRQAFDAAHEQRYGFSDPDAELELVTVRQAIVEPGPTVALGRDRHGADVTPGPAVLRLRGATVVVPAGWTARTDAHGTLRLDADDPDPRPAPWDEEQR